MAGQSPNPYVLGLDLGSNSVGWAALKIQQEGNDQSPYGGLLDMGSRVFEAGVEGNIEQGREESRGMKRRLARSARRLLDRRGRRMAGLFSLLHRAGLLPVEGMGSFPQPAAGRRSREARRLESDVQAAYRDKALALLDSRLREKWLAGAGLENPAEAHRHQHLIPYLLRKKALDGRLEPEEIGRALYHLAQRRGFKSNRKTPAADDKEEGIVKADISALQEEMHEAGARTLGEYFLTIDPEQERIRARYTARAMYEAEFDAIWEAQQKHHPALLTDELRKRVRTVIFFQRNLKSQKSLVGECELEPGRKRMARARLLFQCARILQQVNDTRVKPRSEPPRPLTQEERAALAGALEQTEKMTATQAKKLLGIPANATLNMEEMARKGYQGNVTGARLAKVFGAEAWRALPSDEQDKVVDAVLSVREHDTLERMGHDRWGLAPEQASQLAALTLEPDYSGLSRAALQKLMPLLEGGLSHMEARMQAYPFAASAARAALPMVERAMPGLRNPTVSRVLTEARRVVNAVIARHGKPEMVRIELARDLKHGREARKRMHDNNRKNMAARDAARLRLIEEAGIADPRPGDILKMRLWEECGGVCPYTGKGISMGNLFGPSPEFDVEHIIPFSRSLDDSFANKTLCWRPENAAKHNQTPREAYEADADKLEAILARVRDFKSDLARAKLERFLAEGTEPFEDFIERQLNDTRYASRQAMEYLGLLYGGVVDSSGKRRVQAGRGQVTAYLRNEWRLNGILGGGEKTRDDHRHHAIDAAVTALTDHRAVKMLSAAAANAYDVNRVRFAPIEIPWEGFQNDLDRRVKAIIVSHRVSRKVNRTLHEETLYALREDAQGAPELRVRKRITAITAKEIERIADPKIKQRVEARLAELGGDLKKLQLPENHPWVQTRSGRRIPIRKVRVRMAGQGRPLAPGSPRARQVLSGSNHHVEILEVTDGRGRSKWRGEIVSTLEAMRRKRAGELLVRRDHGADARFVFSIAPGDCIQVDMGEGPACYRVRTFTETRTPGDFQMWFVHLNEARLKKDIQAAKAWYSKVSDTLRTAGCRKVIVTPLGEVRWAND